jgi:hypothetical protein
MEEILKKLAEYFGFAAPFGYAVLAYGLFHWLDENASDEAKAALARTMSFKDYKDEQIASALIEAFDRIYTHPLFRWRAFFRSMLFTVLVSAIFVFELIYKNTDDHPSYLTRATFPSTAGDNLELVWALPPVNVFTDYLSLFVIRPLLIRYGSKPVIGLVLGAVSGTAIVLGGHVLRAVVYEIVDSSARLDHLLLVPSALLADVQSWVPWYFYHQRVLMLPAIIVFAWLPLFALGIVIARLLTPLSWIVGETEWFLKEGKQRPLKAIGYVAAVAVFLGTVAGRAVSSAWKMAL